MLLFVETVYWVYNNIIWEIEIRLGCAGSQGFRIPLFAGTDNVLLCDFFFFFYQQSVTTITTINDSMNNDNDSNIAVIMKRGQRAEGDEC